MSEYGHLGKAASLIGAWRFAHGYPFDHIFFSVDNPHGFMEAVTVHASEDFSRIIVCELPRPVDDA